MNDLYNGADVFFLPSFDELFPVTLLESMCCEKPIVVRNLDLYPCLLEGYYTAGDSVEEFVEKLENLTQKEEYEKASKASALGHQRYTKEPVLKYLQNCYGKPLAIDLRDIADGGTPGRAT